MSDTYSPQNFLRRASNALLSQYFQVKGLLADLDIANLPETKIDPVWDALKSLPEKEEIQRDFRQIFLLSHKRHMPVLFDALKTCGGNTEQFRQRNGNLDRALWIKTEHPKMFEQAYNLAMPETHTRWWRKFRYEGRPNPNLDQAMLDLLERSIGDYFSKKDGRGELCKIEHHQFLGKQCIFAYPSEYKQEVISYKLNEFDRGLQTLAFEVIFIFAPSDGCVDVYLAEPNATAKDICELFVETIFGTKIKLHSKPSFNLDSFHTQNHGLQIPADSPIMDAMVHKLRFAPVGRKHTTITIEANPAHNRDSAYQQLQEMTVQIDSLKQVGLDVFLHENNKKGHTKRRFDISPTSCSLGHDGNDGIIRQFLKTANIEVCV